MRTTIALCVALLSLALSVYAVARPLPSEPAPTPPVRDGVLIPPIWGEDGCFPPGSVDKWIPSLWPIPQHPPR